MRASLKAEDEISGLAGRRPALFCFSHLRWNFVWQRPQHLLSRAARDYDVFFFEEPVLQRDVVAHLEISMVAPKISVLVPVLPEGLDASAVYAVEKELVAEYVTSLPPLKKIFWFYTPMALNFTSELPRDVTVYDNMDELSAFRGADSELERLEIELFSQADVVFTGGHSLFEAKQGRHPNLHCFPSSIDASHFASARLKLEADPQDQKAIRHPRIGFFGVIDERMDTRLVERLADLQPDWHFVMIGPVVKIHVADLPRRANIHWLGMKSYSLLPAYLARWDVGFMPFAINESTRFISPTKTLEYLAAGLPVVSTPVCDVIRTYGDAALVEIADDADAMARAIGTVMQNRRRGWLADTDARLREGSWDATWTAMDRLLRSVEGQPAWNDTVVRSLQHSHSGGGPAVCRGAPTPSRED